MNIIHLINSRIHSSKISSINSNLNIKNKYKILLNMSSYQSFKNNNDIGIVLSLIYYLILQNLIDESLVFYKQNKHLFDMNNTNIYIDYLKCHSLLMDENETIKNI